MSRKLLTLSIVSWIALTGCEGKDKHSEEAHHSEESSHAGDEHKGGDAHGSTSKSTSHEGHAEGPPIQLGTAMLEGQSIMASRDASEIKPGADAPIDVWIDGGVGDAVAVRFWIGTKDAAGSTRTKAEVEDKHWHTHVEVPDPIPADSKLWVEIEGKDRQKRLIFFDLKRG